MRALVTGATGFIGRHVLEATPTDWETIALTRTGPPAWASELERCTWVESDLTDPGFTAALPDGLDVVIHLAQSRFDRSFPDGALDVVDINVGATARLLELVRERSMAGLVLASTATVYAHQPHPLTEDSPLDCSAIYPASKRAAELLTVPYASDLCATVLRLATPYGPGQHGRLMSDLIDRVRNGRAVTLAGRNGFLLSPIYVGDIAQTFWAAAADSVGKRGHRLANVGGPEVLGIRQLAEQIGDALGTEPVFEQLTADEPGGVAPGRGALERFLDLPDPRTFAQGIRLTVGEPAPATD